MLTNSSSATSINLDVNGMLHDGEGCSLPVTEALHAARIHLYLEWTIEQLVQLLEEIKRQKILDLELASQIESELLEARAAIAISKDLEWRPPQSRRVSVD
jgi:hypothetical protein